MSRRRCCNQCPTDDLRPLETWKPGEKRRTWLVEWSAAPTTDADGYSDTVPANRLVSITRERPKARWCVDVEVIDARRSVDTVIRVDRQCVQIVEDDDGDLAVKIGKSGDCKTIKVEDRERYGYYRDDQDRGEPYYVGPGYSYYEWYGYGYYEIQSFWVRAFEAMEQDWPMQGYKPDPITRRYYRVEIWDANPDDEASTLLGSTCRNIPLNDEEYLGEYQLTDYYYSGENTDVTIELDVATNPVDFGVIRILDTTTTDLAFTLPHCPTFECEETPECPDGGYYLILEPQVEVWDLSTEWAEYNYKGPITSVDQQGREEPRTDWVDLRYSARINYAGYNGTYPLELWWTTPPEGGISRQATDEEREDIIDRAKTCGLCDGVADLLEWRAPLLVGPGEPYHVDNWDELITTSRTDDEAVYYRNLYWYYGQYWQLWPHAFDPFSLNEGYNWYAGSNPLILWPQYMLDPYKPYSHLTVEPDDWYGYAPQGVLGNLPPVLVRVASCVEEYSDTPQGTVGHIYPFKVCELPQIRFRFGQHENYLDRYSYAAYEYRDGEPYTDYYPGAVSYSELHIVDYVRV